MRSAIVRHDKFTNNKDITQRFRFMSKMCKKRKYVHVYICILSVFVITVVYFIVKKPDIHVCIRNNKVILNFEFFVQNNERQIGSHDCWWFRFYNQFTWNLHWSSSPKWDRNVDDLLNSNYFTNGQKLLNIIIHTGKYIHILENTTK